MSAVPDSPARRRLVVGSEPEQRRLDAWLAAHLPELSRSRIAQLLADGHVLVNGAPARKSRRPEAGDVIEIDLPAPVSHTLEPEAIPLDIVYQDSDIAVLNKPAGLVVHPAPGHRQGTLVHALLHHLTDLSGIGGVLRPGIVHRLDRDTSGLMLVAKNDAAHRALAAALKRREVRRIYLAAAWGHLAADDVVVEQPIARSPTHRQRMAVVEGGRPARTRLHRLERWRAADLIRAELDTGRTHQIRVHLAFLGHPVIGDAVYGGAGARGISGRDHAWARALEKRTPRQFLHASQLGFRHPRTGEPMHFEVALPEDLAAAADWARGQAT
ncbi:MAG TPA: RluA family pseudouridine synthase [Longimicrobiales bacterium]|nr:RluA family pseudouridine synthase [Longimicrobiales bacterium]